MKQSKGLYAFGNMTLDQAFIEAYLAQHLGSFLQKEGYEILEGKKQLRKKLKEGFQNLIYSVSAYQDAVLLEFHLGIRQDAVENMAGNFTRTLPGWRTDAHTVILSEGKLMGQPYLRHTVHNVEELDGVINHMISFWGSNGRPFLEKNASLKGVDMLLNKNPQLKSPYLPNQAHRYIKGITAAKLAQNETFNDLTQIYLEGLKDLPNGHLFIDSYQKLVSYLVNMSLN